MKLRYLAVVGSDTQEKEPQVQPQPVNLPDGASYQIGFSDAKWKSIRHLAFSSLYRLYESRTPGKEELLVTSDTHLLVAKKDFEVGTLVLPPFVGALREIVRGGMRKQEHLSICVRVGGTSRNLLFSQPALSELRTDTETGAQLVCAPFWLAFKDPGDTERAKALVLRRGVLEVPLENHLCNVPYLNTRLCPGDFEPFETFDWKDNVMYLEIPYLVNQVRISRGDVLFTLPLLDGASCCIPARRDLNPSDGILRV